MPKLVDRSWRAAPWRMTGAGRIKVFLIAALGAFIGTLAAPETAQAQAGCRFTKSLGTNATLCVCESGGRYRIVPEEICRRGGTPNRTTSRPAPRRPAPPPRPAITAAERAETAKIQWALNSAGCDAGTIDGLAGPKTRAATSCLQRLAGQTENGALSTRQKADLIETYDVLAESEGVSGGAPVYASSAAHPASPDTAALVAIMQGDDVDVALASARAEAAEEAVRKAQEKAEAERLAAEEAARAAEAEAKAAAEVEARRAADEQQRRVEELAQQQARDQDQRLASAGAPLTGGEQPQKRVALPVLGRPKSQNAEKTGGPAQSNAFQGGPAFADVPAFCQSQASFYKDGAAPLCLIADLLAAQAEIRLGAVGIADAAASCASSLAPLTSLAEGVGSQGADEIERLAAQRLDVSAASTEDYIASMRLCAGLGYSGAKSGDMALGAEIALLGLGAPGARETLGWRLAHGVGVPRNDAAAAQWLTSAAAAYEGGGVGLAEIDRVDPAAQIRASARVIGSDGTDALLAFPPRE